MSIELTIAIALTLGISGFCSLLEAFILSITTAEIEGLKKRNPSYGKRLERLKNEIEGTSSAILTLNTIANTLGTFVVGLIAARDFGTNKVAVFVTSGSLIFLILILSEIIPKNLGAIYKVQLAQYLVNPLFLIRKVMSPFSFISRFSVGLIIRNKPTVTEEDQEAEIMLLAEKHAKEGALTNSERDMIHNALKLDDLQVSDIMTPRTVVTFLETELTVDEVSRDFKFIRFARIPVYDETIDKIVGLVRRRDILRAKADDKHDTTVRELMLSISFIPETASAADALQLFLRNHQQLAVVVDEFGSTVGVVAMEDIIEHILGREIFEEDDVAVDMRELAKNRAENKQTASPPSTQVEIPTPDI